MSSNCVFTIVAKNYVGLGEILGKTLHQHNPEIDFKIIVADEFDKETILPDNTLIARSFVQYNENEWREMTFKYNLTELCTAIKPSSFKYLFGQGYERVVYFDPDIFIFSSVEEIFGHLKDKDFILTPQINGVHLQYDGEHPEWLMNVNGIFNLGFGGIRKSEKTLAILSWWEERLKDQCFNERSLGQFTDQKWMDWIPGFINTENIHILRNLGMNVAPWNFFERRFEKDYDGYYVTFRNEESGETRRDKLVFIHYSGYDYSKLKKGVVEHKRMSLANYPDLKEAIDEYGVAIKENAATFDKFIDQQYSYECFDNGVKINEFHRRLFHGLPKELRLKIDPYSTSEGSFFQQLKKNGLIDENTPSSITKRSIKDMDGKKRQLNRFFKILFKLMGFKRYVPFVRSFYTYCLPESHTFLINTDKITN